MQPLVYILFVAIFLPGFLARYELLPKVATLLPELVSGIVMLFIVLKGLRSKYFSLDLRYLLLFFLLGLHLIFGAIVNSVPEGVLISGFRTYLKFIPVFFIPVVYAFSSRELRRQLLFLYFIALFQFPVSIYQRFIEGANNPSGDVVKGMFESGGHETIFLISVISVLTAFFYTKAITRLMYIGSVFILFFPTVINETKSTVFLLPVAIFVPIAAVIGEKRERFKAVVLGVSVIGVLGAGFFASYDYFWGKEDESLAHHFDFISEDGRFGEYLAPTTTGIADHRIGKVDYIMLAYNVVSEDPITMIFGLGIGNVTRSSMGAGFEGEYYRKYGHLKGATISRFIWETGFLGLFLVLFIGAMVIRDAWILRQGRGINGSLALGWIGVMSIVLLSLPYRDLLANDAIAYSIIYFSGIIASERSRKRMLSINKKSQDNGIDVIKHNVQPTT